MTDTAPAESNIADTDATERAAAPAKPADATTERKVSAKEGIIALSLLVGFLVFLFVILNWMSAPTRVGGYVCNVHYGSTDDACEAAFGAMKLSAAKYPGADFDVPRIAELGPYRVTAKQVSERRLVVDVMVSAVEKKRLGQIKIIHEGDERLADGRILSKDRVEQVREDEEMFHVLEAELQRNEDGTLSLRVHDNSTTPQVVEGFVRRLHREKSIAKVTDASVDDIFLTAPRDRRLNAIENAKGNKI